MKLDGQKLSYIYHKYEYTKYDWNDDYGKC